MRSILRRAMPGARRRSLLIVVSCSCALPAHAWAQDTADEPTRLETIEVRANPFGKTADELVQPVDVLTGADLDRKRRDTIGETLETQPGVSTSDFGPGAGRPVIRGQAGARVEILENGIGSMDAADVSPDHAVTVDPAHATQIEVLKGPATLLYGSGASAGVVNIIDERLPTEVVEGFDGSAEASYGSNASSRNSAAALGFGRGRHMLRGDYAKRKADDYDIPGNSANDGNGSDGVLSNSATESESGSLSYGYIDGASSVALSVGRFDTRYGLPVEDAAFIDMSQTRYDLQGMLDQPTSWLDSLKLRAGYGDYEHTEFEAPGEPGTMFRNRQHQQRIEAVHAALAGWRGVFGVQQSYRDFQAIGEEAFVPPATTRQLGVFLVEERPYHLGKFELGARIGRDSNQPDGNVERTYTPHSLSAGSVFDLGEHYHLKAYVTRAQRSPAIEELYAFGPHGATGTFERGDNGLRKETATNFEVGLDRHGERFEWQASVYYETFNDYVFLQEVDAGLNADGSGTAASDGEADRVDEEGQFDPAAELLLVNHTQADAKFYGFELQAAYAILTGPMQLHVNAFADRVRGKLEPGANLPRITPARYGIGLDAERGVIAGSLTLTRVESQRDLAPLETPTGAYNLLSADLSYEFSLRESGVAKSQIYVRGRNLLDEEARRATSFLKDIAPMPGASVLAGVRLAF